MSEPTRPPPEVRGITTRRAFLVGGAILVAFAAIAIFLARCDPGTTPSEGRPDPAPRSNEPPGLAPAPPPPATRPAPADAAAPAAPADAARPAGTRVVAEVEVPAAWGARFVARDATLIDEIDARGNPVRGVGMKAGADGRSWYRDVATPGAYGVILGFTWDDREKTLYERFTVDAATGPELRVTLRPRIDPSEAVAPDLARLTVTVLDEAGAPLEAVSLTVRARGGASPLQKTWTTDRRGESVLEAPRGKYRLRAAKEGFGTEETDEIELATDRAHTLVLRAARARLRLRLTRAGPASDEAVFVSLRTRRDALQRYWFPAETRAFSGPAGAIELPAVESREHLVLVTGRGIAPFAVRVEPFAADALERTVDVGVDAGEDVEVRGLDGVEIPEHTLVMIEYAGLLSEVLTHTPEIRRVGERVRILHVASDRGTVTLRLGDRTWKGDLAAAGERPRVVELR